jgi:CubicO group peptidase (beta-lactamase class C family)
LLLAALLSLSGEGLRSRSPAEVSMSPERLSNISRVMFKAINAGGFPGGAVVVGRNNAVVYSQGFGGLTWGTNAAPVSTDESIYDLASLTKVVGATTAAMILVDEGKLKLDEKVSTYVPEFSGGMKNEVTVRLLLEHRSGLPAGRELWRHHYTPEQAKAAVLSTKLGFKPGTGYTYSDLGADVLGWVVESAAGERLDKFLAERVWTPLGMKNTGFTPADSLKPRIAPTEQFAPRGHAVRGEVHDENAYTLGGIVGHAGLFSSASDLAIFAQMMLNGGEYAGTRIISDTTVKLFTARAAGSRALGWEIGNGEHGAGDYFDEHAFGHTGFTGTSLWIDPDRNMFVVLLTNRVYASKARRPSLVIADVRQDVADIAALSVLDDQFAIPVMPEAFRADRAESWNRPFRARAQRTSGIALSAAEREAIAKNGKAKPSVTSVTKVPAATATKPPAPTATKSAPVPQTTKSAPSKPAPKH